MKNNLHTVPGDIVLSATADALKLEAAEAADGKSLRKFSGVAYTGGKMIVGGFSLPVVVDLAGVIVSKKARPILRDHDFSQEIGHTEAIEVSAQRIHVAGAISGVNEHAQRIVASSDNEFPWQMSIGAAVHRVVLLDEGESTVVNGRKVSGPAYIARSATLKEVSFVVLGADDNTSAKVAATAASTPVGVIPMKYEEWLTAKGWGDGAELSDAQSKSLKAMFEAESKPAAPPPPAPSMHGADFIATLESEKKEQARVESINAIAAQAVKLNPTQLDTIERLVKAAHSDKKCDARDFELEMLRSLRPIGPNNVIRASHDGELGGRVIEAAVCKSLGMKQIDKHYDERTLDATDKYFKHGVGLQQLLFKAAAANGQHFDSVTNLRPLLQAAFGSQIQAAGFSTVSLPGILSNVMNKLLLDYFNGVEQVWRQISAIRPVRDFKQVSSYSLTGDMQYEKVGAGGELKHGQLGETTYTNQADTYGKLLAITRTDIINDDLGAFQRVPQRLGRGGALKINDVFWTEFLNNSSFFTTGNANVSTGGGSALGTADGAAINAAEVVFMNQTDPNGKPLGIRPKFLLAPPTLFNTAARWMGGQQIVTGASTTLPSINVYQGRYTVLSSVYMENTSYTGSGTAPWYLLADPMDMPVIETVFLNGRDTPVVESADADFDVLGIQVRAYHDFGCNLQEPRGGVRSAGS